MLSMKPRPVQYGASMRCTQSRGSASERSPVEGVPARRASRWERSVVWGVLRNPAYRGIACFGKTHISARTRVMHPQRRRGTTTPSTTAGLLFPQRVCSFVTRSSYVAFIWKDGQQVNNGRSQVLLAFWQFDSEVGTFGVKGGLKTTIAVEHLLLN